MGMIADVMLDPGGILAWLMVGLIAGWLAGSLMSGGNYGIVGDVIVGLIGALAGGFAFDLFARGAASFWGSILVAFLGACVLIGFYRMLTPAGKRAR
jgi:uncharacterized membrane protein YeaQ/YmgE (transglycosylase-associated protein family)